MKYLQSIEHGMKTIYPDRIKGSVQNSVKIVEYDTDRFWKRLQNATTKMSGV